MVAFKLLPADVLVNINHRTGSFSRVKRWLMGTPYEHVFMYMGKVGLLTGIEVISIPMLFESDGDGVVVESLASRYGQEIVVMRLKSEFDSKRIPAILQEALLLAQDPQSKYDYMCIIRFILPRLICEKLHLPMPVSWHRDARQICSEAVFEVFYRAGLVDVLPSNVPMPEDYINASPLLRMVWRGKLEEVLL